MVTSPCFMQSTSIVSRARADFKGSLPSRLATLVAVASLGGAMASLSPALVGIAVDAIAREDGKQPLRVGGVLGAIGPWLSGSRPAAFGAALVSGTWGSHWIYWVGPLLGGAAAARVYKSVVLKR